ncbi:copper resistance protein CopC [Arthrobacter sp. UYEF3]|uniref:copper resistance CopC family protein n=1 Tax=Arthrobacter sp. UYEF3 TaxID=1756365 RepID=UPI003397DD97
MKTTHRYRSAARLARCLLALSTAAFLLFPGAAAQAHDVLEATDPANSSAVRAVPEKIDLTFHHTPTAIGSVVRVEDATGTDQADGPVTTIDNQVTQKVKTGAPQGKYTVVWRVVSADSHPLEGTFTFTAGATNPTAAATPPTLPVATGTSAGLPAGLLTAGAVAVLVVIAFVVLALSVRRRLYAPEPGP